MWGVGCIFFEMSCGRPLFPGSTIEEELLFIFRTLGSPTEQSWPGISSKKEYLVHRFPTFTPDPPIAARVPRLDPDGLDLLSRLLRFDPSDRIPAADAMHTRYFDSLGPLVHTLADTASLFSLPGIHLTRDPGAKATVTTVSAAPPPPPPRQLPLPPAPAPATASATPPPPPPPPPHQRPPQSVVHHSAYACPLCTLRNMIPDRLSLSLSLFLFLLLLQH